MSKFVILLLIACLAGCASSASAPGKSSSRPHTKPSMCGLYIGGWGACVGNCSAARAHGAATMMCPDICTPAGPGEPPTCQKQFGCEAMQQAHVDSAYASCMAHCNSMPIECR